MLQKEAVAPELLKMLTDIMKEPLFSNYILAGGTALALQIGHRMSDDIDIFTGGKQDNDEYINYFRKNYNQVDVFNNKENIIQLYANNIKIDIISTKGNFFEPPKIIDEIKLFGIKDIAGMKLGAIIDRKKAKDFIDIAYLLKYMSFEEMLDIYKYKNNTENVLDVKKGLSEIRLVNPYTWQQVKMLKNDIFISNIPGILDEEIKNYNKKYGIGIKRI